MPDNKPINQLSDAPIESTQVTSVSRSDDFAVIYSNFVQVGYSAWDFRMSFGLIGTNLGGDPNVTEVAAIVMTPQLAKALVVVLNTYVKGYERDNGVIHMPRSVTSEMQAQAKSGEVATQPTEESQVKK